MSSHPSDQPILSTPAWIELSQLLLDSYARWLGRELIPRRGTSAEQADRLFHAPFVVVSHGTQADPVFHYGNQAALNLWELDLPSLLTMPSRLTAEPVHRDERARLLERTTRDGYVDDYSGIRISRSGRRFRINQAIIWNLVDLSGTYRGQAATFSDWTPLAAAEGT
ncbi:MEKHLA domain-containing protein [Planctomicrobium sp. SH664]|uniref:MEKHLA domain-containing protein n=1 Tax=Planctomicrobium sp. SH664 TaxID=3448125 RepID=UPI003F5C255A